MSALGSLVVKLALEYAEYTRGLDKSGQEALKFAQRQQQALDKAERAADDFLSNTAKKVAGAVAAYVSVTSAVDELKSSINDLASLDDMSQKTGASVENLSRMQKVAKQFGGDMAAIDPLLVKFAKGMAEVDSETSKTHKALKALGFSSQDLARFIKDPAQGMIEVSKALQQYQDDGRKTALVNDLMGKSAADQLPFFNDLAENVDKFTGASAESAARAAALQDQMGGLKIKVNELFEKVAIDALPAMGDFVGALDDVSKSSLTLSANNSVAEWADDTAVGVARLVDVLKIIPPLLRSIGGSFEVVFSDIKLFAAQAQTFGPGAVASLLRGENPWANLGKALDERNATLEQANKRYSDLWNIPANQMEQAVLGRINFRKTYKDGYAKNATSVLRAYQDFPVEVQQAAMLELAGNSGFNVASPYTNPAANRRTLNYASGNAPKDKALNINNSYVADVFSAAIGDLNREGVFADHAARVHEVVQQHIADYKEAQAALNAYNDDWNKYLGGLEQSLAALTQENELYGLNAKQIAAVNLQRAEENLALAQRNGVAQDYLDRLSREVDLRKQILDKTGALEQKRTWTGIFDSIESTAHDTFVSIFDSGKSAFDRLRDTLKNGLLDLLYQMTLKKWIINISAAVTGSGAAGSALAGEGVSAAGGSGSLGLGTLKSAFDVFTQGFEGANSAFIGAINDFGASVADLGGVFSDIGGWIGTNNTLIAGVAPFVPSIISLLSGDVKGAISSGIGAGIGYALGGPIGGAIGSGLGSLVGGLFGGKQGKPDAMAWAMLNTSTGDAMIKAKAANDGGNAKAIAPIAERLSEDFGRLATGLGAGFKTSGGYAANVKVLTRDGKMAFAVMDDENTSKTKFGKADVASKYFFDPKNEKALQEATADLYLKSLQKFATLPAYLQKLVDAQKENFKDAVEDSTSSTVFLSFIGNLKLLHDSMDLMPPLFDKLKLAVDGITDSNSLAKVNAQVAALTSFYSLFYTQQEQFDFSAAQLGKAFADLNLAIPSSREAYRALVEGVNTTTQSGLDLFNTLVGLAPSMDAYYRALQEQQDALNATSDSIEKITLSTDKFRTLVDFTRAQRYADSGINIGSLPGFASGGDHTGGLRIVGENGPELEATGPSRITNTADLLALLRNPQANTAALVAEIRQLRAELQAANIAQVQASQKTAKILDKFDHDGLPATRTV